MPRLIHYHTLQPGVKLPCTVDLQGRRVPITILEAVIKQTGSYASSRKGRLSVFWGDQVIHIIITLFSVSLHLTSPHLTLFISLLGVHPHCRGHLRQLSLWGGHIMQPRSYSIRRAVERERHGQIWSYCSQQWRRGSPSREGRSRHCHQSTIQVREEAL